MSFVNLLSNDRWTDADITRRTEAMVHSVVPQIEENILNRKLAAAGMGQWTLTDDEMATLAAYSQACMAAHQAGIDARSDAAKLDAVLAYESALARLELPVIDDLPDVTDQEGVTSPNPGLAVDIAEREAAQFVVDDVTDETLLLWNLRHPVVEEPEVLPG